MARDKNAKGAGTATAGSRRIGAGPSGGARGAAGAGSGAAKGARAAGPGKQQAKAGRAAKRAARRERLAQIRTAFQTTRRSDPRLVPLLAAALLVPFVLLLLLGVLLGHPVLFGIVGLLVGLIACVAVFGRRVQNTAFSQVEGQVGAAAAVLNGMRGDWRVTPVVGFTREQDMVHRVVGRPGVVLVGEGSPQRTRGLLVNEKKKLARFIGDTPVYDVTVGDGEGQVPLRGLERHFAKLPRNVTPKDVNVLDRKLKAMAPAPPVPKGPVPGGGRMPRGKMR